MKDKFYLNVKSGNAYNSSFELLVKDLHQYKKQGYKIALLSGSRTSGRATCAGLTRGRLKCILQSGLQPRDSAGEIMVVYGHAKKGFEYPLIKFALMTETDIFGQEQTKKKKKKYIMVRESRISQSYPLEIS